MAKKKQRARPSPEKRRDELLRAFEAWTSQRGGLADVDSVRLLLDFRSDYLDSNLACWRASDLSHLLLGLFPRKVVLDAEEVADIVPAAGAFLHYGP